MEAVGHGVGRVVQRAKVAAHGSRSDDIQCQATGPHAHLDLALVCVRVEGSRVHLRLELVQQLAGLVPHQPVQGTDILDVERGSQRPSLLAMGLALGQNQPKADNPGQEVPRTPRLLKVVRPRAHDVQQRLVAGHQQVRLVDRVAEVDEAIVGDGADPAQRNASSRVIEDDFQLQSAAL